MITDIKDDDEKGYMSRNCRWYRKPVKENVAVSSKEKEGYDIEESVWNNNLHCYEINLCLFSSNYVLNSF